jgi:hypothetical protein
MPRLRSAHLLLGVVTLLTTGCSGCRTTNVLTTAAGTIPSGGATTLTSAVKFGVAPKIGETVTFTIVGGQHCGSLDAATGTTNAQGLTTVTFNGNWVAETCVATIEGSVPAVTGTSVGRATVTVTPLPQTKAYTTGGFATVTVTARKISAGRWQYTAQSSGTDIRSIAVKSVGDLSRCMMSTVNIVPISLTPTVFTAKSPDSKTWTLTNPAAGATSFSEITIEMSCPETGDGIVTIAVTNLNNETVDFAPYQGPAGR